MKKVLFTIITMIALISCEKTTFNKAVDVPSGARYNDSQDFIHTNQYVIGFEGRWVNKSVPSDKFVMYIRNLNPLSYTIVGSNYWNLYAHPCNINDSISNNWLLNGKTITCTNTLGQPLQLEIIGNYANDTIWFKTMFGSKMTYIRY